MEGQEHQSNSDVTDHSICDDIIHCATPVLLNLNNDDSDIYSSHSSQMRHGEQYNGAQNYCVMHTI